MNHRNTENIIHFKKTQVYGTLLIILQYLLMINIYNNNLPSTRQKQASSSEKKNQ